MTWRTDAARGCKRSYRRRQVGRHVGRAPSAEPCAYRPWHQNEVASLPPKGEALFWKALESTDRSGGEPMRPPSGAVLSLSIPPTLLARADKVIERDHFPVGTIADLDSAIADVRLPT
jgi:hypothetical protein